LSFLTVILLAWHCVCFDFLFCIFASYPEEKLHSTFFVSITERLTKWLDTLVLAIFLQPFWDSLVLYSPFRFLFQPVGESTKQFGLSFLSVILIMTLLSICWLQKICLERSASDAESLVRAIRPKVVVAQIGPSSVDDVREEESNLGGDETCFVPTSWLGVLKGCFFERINWSKYESRVGLQVLRTIFGTGFYGHVLAAKQAATENRSLFLFLETPCRNGQGSELDASGEQNSDKDGPNKSGMTPSPEVSQGSGLFRKLTSLSDDMVSSVPMGSDRYTLARPLHSSALKVLASSIALSLQNSLALDSGSNFVPIANSASSPAECEFDVNDQIPSFMPR
jgi:hypothetical protein